MNRLRQILDPHLVFTTTEDFVQFHLLSLLELDNSLFCVLESMTCSLSTGLSAACSLVSLTWAMTAYSDSQRRAHCSLYKRRLVRLLMHYLWQLFMTSSRIAAFVFCAFALHYWVLAVMGEYHT